VRNYEKFTPISKELFHILREGQDITVNFETPLISNYYMNGKLMFHHYQGKDLEFEYDMAVEKENKNFMEICELERKKLEAKNMQITKARKNFMRLSGKYPDVVGKFKEEDNYRNDNIVFTSKKVREDWTDIEFSQQYATPYKMVGFQKLYADYTLVFGSDPDDDKYQDLCKKIFGERAIQIIREEIISRNSAND